MSFTELTTKERMELLAIARQSIDSGLVNGIVPKVKADDYSALLNEKAACFVTLKLNGELRGCIGTLEAEIPLVKAVSRYAFASAFEDSRFLPLSESELEGLDIEISVLTLPTPLVVTSEQELLSKLRAGIDGLILEEGSFKATFLPAVWDQLADPQDFLAHLKLKACLPADYWSDKLEFSTYQTVSFCSSEFVE